MTWADTSREMLAAKFQLGLYPIENLATTQKLSPMTCVYTWRYQAKIEKWFKGNVNDYVRKAKEGSKIVKKDPTFLASFLLTPYIRKSKFWVKIYNIKTQSKFVIFHAN